MYPRSTAPHRTPSPGLPLGAGSSGSSNRPPPGTSPGRRAGHDPARRQPRRLTMGVATARIRPGPRWPSRWHRRTGRVDAGLRHRQLDLAPLDALADQLSARSQMTRPPPSGPREPGLELRPAEADPTARSVSSGTSASSGAASIAATAVLGRHRRQLAEPRRATSHRAAGGASACGRDATTSRRRPDARPTGRTGNAPARC